MAFRPNSLPHAFFFLFPRGLLLSLRERNERKERKRALAGCRPTTRRSQRKKPDRFLSDFPPVFIERCVLQHSWRCMLIENCPSNFLGYLPLFCSFSLRMQAPEEYHECGKNPEVAARALKRLFNPMLGPVSRKHETMHLGLLLPA